MAENVYCNCVNRKPYQEDVMEQMSTGDGLNLACDDRQESSWDSHRESGVKQMLNKPLLPSGISANFLK